MTFRVLVQGKIYLLCCTSVRICTSNILLQKADICVRVSQAVRKHLGEARCIFAPRASPLALVMARRRPSVLSRRSRRAAPRLATVRVVDWRVQILLPRPRVCDEHLFETTFRRASSLSSLIERVGQVIGVVCGSRSDLHTPDLQQRLHTGRWPWLALAAPT